MLKSRESTDSNNCYKCPLFGRENCCGTLHDKKVNTTTNSPATIVAKDGTSYTVLFVQPKSSPRLDRGQWVTPLELTEEYKDKYRKAAEEHGDVSVETRGNFKNRPTSVSTYVSAGCRSELH